MNSNANQEEWVSRIESIWEIITLIWALKMFKLIHNALIMINLITLSPFKRNLMFSSKKNSLQSILSFKNWWNFQLIQI